VVIEDPEQVDELARLPSETVLRVSGVAVLVASAPGGVEVHQPAFEVVSVPVGPPRFDLFRPAIKAQLPTILDHAVVALRHPRLQAVHRLAAVSAAGYRCALGARGFVEIFTPKLVASATEGGANVFSVDYFGRPAFLAQSPRFCKQIIVGAFERVFEIGPAFRAEPHDAPRHLNEFVSLDFEMGFVEDHTTAMAILTDALGGMLEAVREDAPEAVALRKLALHWVIRMGRQQVERIMDSGQSRYYHHAVAWLSRSRAAALGAGRKDDWRQYVDSLLLNMRANTPWFRGSNNFARKRHSATGSAAAARKLRRCYFALPHRNVGTGPTPTSCGHTPLGTGRGQHARSTSRSGDIPPVPVVTSLAR
jgi:aspartyl/asparaginyl-tRNA synthetase